MNFSYQSSHESSNLMGDSGEKQNQVFDLGASFKTSDDSKILISTGRLQEFDDNILNAKSSGAFSAGDGVQTNYIKLTALKKLTKNIKLIASISHGSSKIDGNSQGIFREFNNVKSRAMSLAFIANDLFGGNIGFTYLEPMRIYQGQVSFDVPIARDNFGNVTRYQGSASLASQGKERDFEIFYSRLIGNSSSVSFNLLLQQEPGNIKGAKDNHLGFVTYQKNF